MFERNAIDNGNDLISVAAEIGLDTGEAMTGRFLLSRARDLHATLNGPDLFILFEPYGEDRRYLAKASLRDIRVIDVGRAPRLTAKAHDQDNFDPHHILGLGRSAGVNDIRKAWHHLSLRYHPDRYANAELPDEVIGYLQTMARRVNAAYEALEATAEKRRREKLRAEHAAPIYESRSRA
ncbi:MAG: DnaJ domain-containing protein [Pseudomonadota bacterium]